MCDLTACVLFFFKFDRRLPISDAISREKMNITNLPTYTETDPFRPRSKATILLSHKPGLDVEGDDKLLIGSRKLLEGCPRPLQSHYIEHFKGHFVLMDQVLTQTALSAVLVRTTNTAQVR